MIKKFKIRRHLSIRFRIFVAMTSLVIIAFGGIAALTIPQYKEQSNKYHEQRLERKKTQLQRSISYVFQETPFDLNKKEIDSIFQEKIFQIIFLLTIILALLPGFYLGVVLFFSCQ